MQLKISVFVQGMLWQYIRNGLNLFSVNYLVLLVQASYFMEILIYVMYINTGLSYLCQNS